MQHQPFLPFTDDELYGSNWEYLLIVPPDRYVADKVWEVKEDFFEEFEQQIAIDTLPHITVAAFNAKEELQETLIMILRRVCKSQKNFIVDLKDYEGFGPSTLFVKVQDHTPFLLLAESLQSINDCLLENGCSSAFLVNHPHLTVARSLPYKVYCKAMEEYSLRRFQESFTANELRLLRRRHRGDKYKSVAVLRFSSSNHFSNQPNQYAISNYRHSRLPGV